MHYVTFIKASALLQFIVLVLGHPLRQEQIAQPAHLLRRASYSVVAVDGGSAATSTSSPMKTVTRTASETKTIDQTKTIYFTPTLSTTLTVTESRTLSVTSGGCDNSIVVAPSSKTIAPQSPATITTLVIDTTTSVKYGTPAMPATQSHGDSARYSASRPWNSTVTSNYGPTGTASPTGSI